MQQATFSPYAPLVQSLPFLTEAALHPSFDVLGAVIYGTELALWVGILICGVVFNLWQWLNRPERREEAAEPEGTMFPYNANVRP